MHQKYITYLVTELKPVLTELIRQSIDNGELQFEHPAALAEIVLIELLEKGSGNPAGVLNYLMML